MRETKTARANAMALALAAGAGGLQWERARMTATFYWPDRRRRDVRNAEASLKAYEDGLVDAGVIVDDRHEVLRHGETVFDVDRHDPRVVLRLERLD